MNEAGFEGRVAERTGQSKSVATCTFEVVVAEVGEGVGKWEDAQVAGCETFATPDAMPPGRRVR